MGKSFNCGYRDRSGNGPKKNGKKNKNFKKSFEAENQYSDKYKKVKF